MREEEITSLQHIKQVSIIKHLILTGYLPSWIVILGNSHERLFVIDCFAGPGRYECGGDVVDGSPVIAVKAALEFSQETPHSRLGIVLVDDDDQQLRSLEKHLEALQPYPENLKVFIRHADSHAYIPRLLDGLSKTAPSFFIVDPYGHPLSVPIMNEILARPRTELFINLMWYRINMDLGNPAVEHHVTELFGDDDWKKQEFLVQSGRQREEAFLNYFCSRLSADFILPFRIRFDKEDRIYGQRTKYYLLHASNHRKAPLIMKEVMWPLGDEEGTFDYSGESQGVLISQSPHENELREILVREFSGKTLAFDQLRGQTWNLPFIEKHYRSVLQQLRSEDRVIIKPVTSKRGGLKGRDLVQFL